MNLALTIFQDAAGQAKGAVQVTKAMLEQQKTDAYNWVPYQLINKENYQQFADRNQKL